MEFETFVLAASTGDLAEEPAARGVADAVEYRMDLAGDPETALAEYDGRLPVIATNRVAWDGGNAPDDADRVRLLRRAAAHERVGAIDIELGALETDAARELLDEAARGGTTVIVSVHDFDQTPGRETMLERLEQATEHGGVGKLAVTATGAGDVLDLLVVTHEATQMGMRVATLAMGEAGRHARVIAPLYGSRIGYAPIDAARATAPGQYDLLTLRDLITAVSPRNAGETGRGPGGKD